MRDNTAYGIISRLNHWILALAICGMLGLGLYLEFGGLSREAKAPLLGIHKALGVLLLVAGTWRVLWRVREGFQRQASDAYMTPIQQKTARYSQVALLLGTLLMPISGILSSICAGRDVSVFGLFHLPALMDSALVSSLASALHQWLGYAMVVLIVLHIGAAMKHHFLDRDSTLTRMALGRRRVPYS